MSVELENLIERAMTALAVRRPIFHSEADFQLALAWELQILEPDAQLRLERRVLADPVIALDVLAAVGRDTYALELKYLKGRLDIDLNGEPFRLREGAPDVERHDVLRDVARLERVVAEGRANAGCALVLSNASSLWRPGSGRPTGFDQFRIHDGAVLGGTHGWGPTAGAGTRTAREVPLKLAGTYECRWRPYSTVSGSGSGSGSGELRYLALVVA